MKIHWAFDLISPFAYLGLKQMPRLPSGIDVELVPTLFGVVLNHHGQIGPAEIGPKRRFTYRFVIWRARQMGVPFKMPPTHPFNCLSAMRLVVAAGSHRRAVETAFDFVFGQGRDVTDPAVLEDLARALGLADAKAALNDAAVKQSLRETTEWAIQRGVFGVPTYIAGNELFWGQDAFEMLVDYLRDPQGFDDEEMRRIDSLPVGVTRSRVTPS
ncbi:MAG: 2-hydroxychromene-2-carboxylate isomerase [Proteobacteria bacterium]|nr:2-hydroxychromene-2-carboxylate isomerase [Pseudomonadota bacterium]